jgi:all-trans-8'-apo-beta-carotenal 15,15'-oxygenase
VTTVREVPAFPAAVFATVPDESTYEIRRIEGTIPAGLSGTTYWNGPARFGIGPGRARHWLDGDGMVTALHMQAGAIRFTNKFVRTRKWNEETSAGRPVFRCFATAFRGDRLLRGIGLESPANISVVPFDRVLLAFGEQGLPWRIDPYSLDTQGQYSFGGTINEVTPFAAHAKLDADSGALVNFGVSFDPRRPSVTLYDFAPEGALVSRRCIPLEQPSSIHDCVLTSRSAIFYVSPYIVDVRSLVRGGTLLDALTWRPEFGSRIVVVDRASGSARTIRIAGRYCLHTINAFGPLVRR